MEFEAYHLGLMVIAYIIGSIPMGLIVAYIAGIGDIRKQGSGNIGATNMVRAGGKALGLITLLLDAAKAVAAIIICTYASSESYSYLYGFSAVLGHCYPLWLKGKGGKGVATGLGVIATIHLAYIPDGWWIIPILTFIWIGLFWSTRIVSIASLATFLAASLISIVVYGIWILPLLLTLLIFMRHKENIIRLVHGTEHAFTT